MNRPTRSVHASTAFGGLALCVVLTGASPAGQTAQVGARASVPQRLTIPYLANASRPDDLDFAAAQCEVSTDRQRMDCNFRQVFLTASPKNSLLGRCSVINSR